MKLGFINFGGPTGQIAIMHEEIVERRRWITNGRFLHALNYCMLLPGPEAQQLAIYVGWLLHKVRGGLVAGIAFVLPSFFVMLVLSWLYVVHGDVTWVSATLSGLAAAVIGIVASATIRVAKKALANGLMVGVAVAAFVSIFLLHVPFPVIVLGAAAIGLVGGRSRRSCSTWASDASWRRTRRSRSATTWPAPRTRARRCAEHRRPGRGAGGVADPDRRRRGVARARRHASRRWGGSSARRRWSRSAAPTPCCRT